MGILIDIIIITIMISCTFIGYKKGLIKVAIGFLAFILSILIALIFYKQVANQIAINTQIDEKINEAIYVKIKDIDFKNISEEQKKENNIIKIGEKYITDGIEKTKEDTAKYISESISITILEGLTFIGLLIALRVILLVLNLASSIIANLPLIKQFNKSGGIIYGIIEGFLIINSILALLYILNPIYKNGEIENTIEQSKIGKMIYENNFIINTISK